MPHNVVVCLLIHSCYLLTIGRLSAGQVMTYAGDV